MMLVVAYDVDTTDKAGAKRLRKVAQLCERYGSRVQNSVFEVLVEPAQLVALKAGLERSSAWIPTLFVSTVWEATIRIG